jgi:formylglycine-generating enzyme required for sulfatase activity
MHLMPMEEKHAEAFIRKWYRIVETGISCDKAQAEVAAREKADHLINRLRRPDFRSRRVFEMTRNPLLLTNICLVHQGRGNLPHTRSLLYEECIDVLLERWRGAIGFQSRVTAQAGRRVLQPAAYWLHREEKRTRAAADELSTVIEPSLKAVGWSSGSATDFLQAVRDESGLLTGWSHGEYGFMHLGFQEYLAAREIQRLFLDALGNSDVLRELAQRLGDGWWQEVILLLLARGDHCLFGPFMKEVLRRTDFIEHSAFLDMCIEEAAERTVEPFVDLLARKPAGNPSRLWERQLAVLRLIEGIDTKSIEPLLTELGNHPYEDIRRWLNARRFGAGPEVLQTSRGGYELVRIPAGKFLMGSPETEDDRFDREGPQHEVTVTDFYMGRYPVTNEEYGRFLEANPGIKEPEFWGYRNFNQSRQPVVGISWDNAKKFAEWVGLDLPSEAQWEYACRAGTTTRFYTGDTEDGLLRAGWFIKNSGERLHAVGEKESNEFGLFDMHGNVWEWCEDHWHQYYENAPNDGKAWVDKVCSSDRVLRGGAWSNSSGLCRSAYRIRDDPSSRFEVIGFRLVFLPGSAPDEPNRRDGSGGSAERRAVGSWLDNG